MRAPRPTPPRFPARRRNGRCFELAARGQTTIDPTWTLIHGRAALVGTLPLLIAHAWLAKGAYIYDPTLDEVLPAKEYKTRYKAVVEQRYSITETRRLLVAHEHWGPWHMTHDITVAAELLRKVVDGDRALHAARELISTRTRKGTHEQQVRNRDRRRPRRRLHVE